VMDQRHGTDEVLRDKILALKSSERTEQK
jgi:hypothetical protein